MNSHAQPGTQSKHGSIESLSKGALDGESLSILRVASDVYPDVTGGLNIHVHDMSRMQAEWGHNVTVLTSDHGDRDKPTREQRHGYEMIRHREVVRPLDNTIIPGIFRTLRGLSDEYDVIHAHSHLFFSTNATALLSRFIDTPLVVTNHGLISQTAPEWVQKMFIPTVGMFTLNSADSVLCYTETDKRRLEERGVESPISIVHNGVDCEMFAPQKGSGSRKQILFVGRFKPGKGLRNLLDAFETIHSEFPEYELKIVGEGPMEETLVKDAAQKGIDSHVDFAGTIDNEELASVYAESDVFVLPSRNEGLPRSVLEAMACGTPVVTADLDQLEAVVDSAGLTFPRERPEDLAPVLHRLLSEEELRDELGRTGREKAQTEYSWKETVRRTTDMYRELLK